MRLHQEERPFKCTHCNYASKTQNNLKLHMRTHKDLAPLKCPQCEFRGMCKRWLDLGCVRMLLAYEYQEFAKELVPLQDRMCEFASSEIS